MKIQKLKKSSFFSLLLMFSLGAFAQSPNSNEYVDKFVSLPAISVNTVPDSSIFTNKNLKSNAPFLLMFFSPDCDHCHKQVKELLAYKAELKGIQILLLSVAPFGEIKDFYYEFGLASMSNLKVGQDKISKWALPIK